MSRRSWPNPLLPKSRALAGQASQRPVTLRLDEPQDDWLDDVLFPPEPADPPQGTWTLSADPQRGLRLEVLFAQQTDGGGSGESSENPSDDAPEENPDGTPELPPPPPNPFGILPETAGRKSAPVKGQIVWRQERELTFPTVRLEGKVWLVEVDSIEQLLHWSENAPQVWKAEPQSRKVTDDRTSWTRTRTFEDAIRLARDGWAEGRELMEKVLADYRPPQYQAPTPKLSWDVAGATPDVPRYVAGAPDAMIPPDDSVRQQKPIIRLVVHITYAHSVSPQAIINWGAGMVSHIHRLEAAGAQVEVTGVWYSTPSHGDSGPQVAIRFPLKRADQALNLERLAFWLAHPASFRRIEFSCLERMDVERWYHSGYGMASQSYRSPDAREIVLWGRGGSRSVADAIESIGNALAVRLPDRFVPKTSLKF